MDAAVAVTDLVVDRGRSRVLHGLTFTVPAGRVTGLLGPSGSGKTTLIRAVVGVQRVRSGTVTVLGLPAGAAALRARIGYVTQAPSVYADLTVRENVRYFAALARRRPGGGRHRDRRRRPDRRRRAAGRGPLRRPARPGLAGLRAGRPPRPARPRRADRRPGPGAAGRALAALRRPRPRRDDAAGLQPRDGRGRPLRRAAAPARGRLLAESTPARLRADSGTDDLEEAFLRLVRSREEVRGMTAPPSRPRSARGSPRPPPGGCCASCGTTTAPSR